MQSEITVVERQGVQYVRDIDGYETPIIAGGSGNEAPPSDDGGTAPTEGDGVQPTEGQPSSEGTTPEGGQGFIEPYLNDVDETMKPVVQAKLDQFRRDQDAQVTRRFEQMQQETEVPVTVYNALMNDPVGTMQWIAERFEQDRGVNLRDQLLEQWQAAGEPTGDEGIDDDTPLTREQVDQILEEREQERQRQTQEAQAQAQRAEQQTRTVHSWMDEAAKTHGLTFEDTDGSPDPLRTAIALQANELHSSGQAKGKAAIEMVVESFAKRMGSTSGGNNEGGQGKEPRTANGGSAPSQQKIDVSDPKQRRQRMYDLFPTGQ